MIRQFLKSVKVAASETMYRTGLLQKIVRKKMTDRVSVLMYHRVISDEMAPATDSHPGIIVSEKHFDEQMAAIRKFMHPLRLSDFEDLAIHGGEIPKNSCLVTFDDGWLDNYEIALPVLKRHKIPAAVFVPIDYVSGDEMFWQEEMLMRLTFLLQLGDAESLGVLRDFIENGHTTGDISIADIRSHVVNFKSRTYDEVSDGIQTLRNATSHLPNSHYNRYMNWQQLRELRAAGIEIASHACSHRRLSRLSPDDCQLELQRSKKLLERELGIVVRSVAYPNGDVNAHVALIAKQCGYQLGFGTTGGLFSPDSDRYNIPRINLHDNNSGRVPQYLCTCVGLF